MSPRGRVVASIVKYAASTVISAVLVNSSPFIVQSLSSRYAVVLGGYGPGYQELKEVEVVRHNRVCQGAISNVPRELGRFLGDVSGMAEYVTSRESVLFCRHSSCWMLRMGPNKWKRVGGFKTVRDRSSSAAVGGTMLVLGGRGDNGDGVVSIEMFDSISEQWVEKPEWDMKLGRFSFCSVPLNETALLVIGGYSGKEAVTNVDVLDTATGRWDRLADLPSARYGHACLLMEWAGAEGVLVSGGALTRDH